MSQVTITAYATTYRIEIAYSEVRAMGRDAVEREVMQLVAKRFEEAGATVQDLKNPLALLTQHAMMGHTITLEIPHADPRQDAQLPEARCRLPEA